MSRSPLLDARRKRVRAHLRGLGYVTVADQAQVYWAAMPAARLSVIGEMNAARALDWLAQDHPTRVGLILETLGRPERL